MQNSSAPPDEHSPAGKDPGAGAIGEGSWTSRPARGGDSEDGDEIEVPLARASDEERLATKQFDRLEPHELAQLYGLMEGLRLATPTRSTRRFRRGRRGQRIDMRRTLRRSLRTGGDPIRLARRRRRRTPRRLVMLCDISGSMEPYTRAYLQFLTCAAGAGPNAEAFAFATRLTRLTRALSSRHPERAIQRAAAAAPRLVKRHSHRRRSQGVQRPPRPPRDGSWRRDRDPVGRLGAWRSPSGRARDAAAVTARLPDRVGESPRRRDRVHRRGGRHGGRASLLRRARERPQFRGAFARWSPRSATSGLKSRTCRDQATADEPEPWASATPIQGSSVAMPSGHGPSKGNTTPGWVDE